MNPGLALCHPYPFEKLALLKEGVVPAAHKAHIAMSIGEPAHPTPDFILDALATNAAGYGNYPTTKGIPALREVIANWLSRRFNIPRQAIDPDTQILPVSGTREALFSIAQALVDPAEKPIVIMPNPFYQIYEGAALLAGAEPYYLNTLESDGYLPDFESVPETIWRRCRMIYICSPSNPSGSVLPVSAMEKLISLAEKYDFIIASDECYSELYDDESSPPPGLLQAAHTMGNSSFKNCLVFHSLSKRSNAPGLRSGFVAGDAKIMQAYFQYRTYQGCAMPLPTQHASICAWQDEAHVNENRELYREKFKAFIEILSTICDVKQPPASFYIWLKTAIPDTEFARQLFAKENITVLPGSYLSREFDAVNPGANHVRIALVAPLTECTEAAHRIKNFVSSLN